MATQRTCPGCGTRMTDDRPYCRRCIKPPRPGRDFVEFSCGCLWDEVRAVVLVNPHGTDNHRLPGPEVSEPLASAGWTPEALERLGEVFMGVDYGRPGGDFTVEVTARRLPDGRVEVLEVKRRPATEADSKKKDKVERVDPARSPTDACLPGKTHKRDRSGPDGARCIHCRKPLK